MRTAFETTSPACRRRVKRSKNGLRVLRGRSRPQVRRGAQAGPRAHLPRHPPTHARDLFARTQRAHGRGRPRAAPAVRGPVLFAARIFPPMSRGDAAAGCSVGAAAGTRTFRRDESRRGRDADVPRRRESRRGRTCEKRLAQALHRARDHDALRRGQPRDVVRRPQHRLLRGDGERGLRGRRRRRRRAGGPRLRPAARGRRRLHVVRGDGDDHGLPGLQRRADGDD